jgi:DtxR family transcriptional regulator, Mn-dependent transcriptional regulator
MNIVWTRSPVNGILKPTMPSVTVENYLKQLYLEQHGGARGRVQMGRLATAMGVVPGTATSMVKALAESGLVEYQPRGGVKLTPGGEQLALHVLRRHRLVELFLVKVLQMDWTEVHEEAEELEHAISDKVLARIDELLGHPQTDPHGDPIPPKVGRHTERKSLSLADCPEHKPMRITRVLNQDRAFLRFAEKSGLVPGVCVTVTHREAAADSISLRAKGNAPVTLGSAAAAKILVEPT